MLAKLGVPMTCSDIFGTAGPAWLDGAVGGGGHGQRQNRTPQAELSTITVRSATVAPSATTLTPVGHPLASMTAPGRPRSVMRLSTSPARGRCQGRR